MGGLPKRKEEMDSRNEQTMLGRGAALYGEESGTYMLSGMSRYLHDIGLERSRLSIWRGSRRSADGIA